MTKLFIVPAVYGYFSKWILAGMLCSSGERDDVRGRGDDYVLHTCLTSQF